MTAHVGKTAPRVALKVVVTVVSTCLVPVQTLAWMHTRVRRAAESRIYTVVIRLAEELSAYH